MIENFTVETVPQYNQELLNQTIIPNEVFLANTLMGRIFYISLIAFVCYVVYLRTKNIKVLGIAYFLNICNFVLALSYKIQVINEINIYVIFLLGLLTMIVATSLIMLVQFILPKSDKVIQ